VLEGVIDGTLDVIATDHAPHHYDEKEQAFEDAPFGLVGLETALGVAWTELVIAGHLDAASLIHRMSVAPARAFNLRGGTLATGSDADVTVFDPAHQWIVDPASFLSRSRNTPFAGRRLIGAPVMTIVGGAIGWERAADREEAAR
jgi:dihydroorotase